MKAPRKMNKKKSKKLFRRTAGKSKSINRKAPRMFRGGIRI